MRNILQVTFVLVTVSSAFAQHATFQGECLNPSRSELNGVAAPGSKFLHVEQTRNSLTFSSTDAPGGVAVTGSYPLDGKSGRFDRGASRVSTKTKWEGDALLVNALFSGPQNYAVDERWTRSRDGQTLTITRTVVRPGGESESTLLYENPALVAAPKLAAPTPAAVTLTENVAPTQPESSQPQPALQVAAPANVRLEHPDYVINPGTRILMQLTNAVNTRHTMVGDKVYLETAVPVFVDRRMIIPTKSYVLGTVIESTRAGRIKGKSALNIRFESITLPNGTTRNLASRPGSVDGGGNLDRSEGRIRGESNKGGDAGTVAKTTAAGAGIGTIAGAAAGHLGMGVGIGAAAGALGGLAGVLGSRGPDVVLRPGTTMEFILDRELRFTESELIERVH